MNNSNRGSAIRRSSSVCSRHDRSRVIAFVGAVWLVASTAHAQKSAPSALDLPPEARAKFFSQLELAQAEKRARTPAQQKLDAQLLFAARKDRGEEAVKGLTELEVHVAADTKGRVKVEVIADISAALLSEIEKHGGTVSGSFAAARTIYAIVPLKALERLAERADVQFIRPEPVPMTNAGTVNSEGDRAHGADVTRARYCVDGTGVKIGVISDGVKSLGASQQRGELSQVTVLNAQAGPANRDEGTAMLEIVHDVAPGASLYFSTGFGGPAQMAENIIALRDAGCGIIVDDVTYSTESPFQDGVISQAVTTVSNSGVLYFSSAANSGNVDSNTSSTWEGDFSDGGADPATGRGAYRLHTFGTQTANMTTDNKGAGVILYWNDPLGASSNDYDLYVTNSTGAIVTPANTIQAGSQDPFESTGVPAGGRIYISKANSAVDRFLHLETDRHPLAVATQGSTRGHNASGAANAFCVAAAPAAAAHGPGEPTGPFPGVFSSSNSYELFSSDGPRRIFFDAAGNAITPGNFSATGGQLLQKPDFAAADGVNTTIQPFAPFFGTSAAAPHAAAIAALIKATDPGLTPAQIRTALVSSAIDIGPAGVDRDTGAGIIMPFAALQTVAPPSPHVSVIGPPGTGASPNRTVPKGPPGSFGLITFHIELTDGGPNPVTVHISTQDGSAHAGGSSDPNADYSPLNFDFSFPAGTTYGTSEFQVSIYGNNTGPGNKTFTFNISNPQNASICVPKATCTILNQPVPATTVDAADDSVIEADPAAEVPGVVSAEFAVTLSAPSDRLVTVNYATADGSAIAGTNYQARSGTVEFQPGETLATVIVPVFDDGVRGQPDVTFSLNLTNPTNTTLGRNPATCTIHDPPPPAEAPPSVFAGQNSIAEGNAGTVQIGVPIRLSHASSQVVKVSFITSPTGGANSATEGIDYQANGGTLTFNPGQIDQVAVVAVIGDTNLEPSEQFYIVISNAENATLGNTVGIATINDDDGGQPTPTPTPGETPTPTPPGPVKQTQNISTRIGIGTGEYVGIGGFIVVGDVAKRVMIRAIGPSLANAGVAGVLGDTTLALHDAFGNVLAVNDDWSTSSQIAEITASTLAPSNSHESAIIATLGAGGYTAIVGGYGNTTGIALIEAYDLDQASASRLANISTRGYVGTGDYVLIGGFIVGAPGEFIIRAIGPSLTAAGVGNALADPLLEFHDVQGTLIDQNDDWGQNPYAQLIISAGLAPSHLRESALIYNINPGNYTVIVRGYNDSTGVALVEVYNVQ